MPFFKNLFSSSASSENNKQSHFNRFLSKMKGPTYQPDMYDDLRGDGFFFRPSDTLHSTVTVPVIPGAGDRSSMYGMMSKSTTSLGSTKSASQAQHFTRPCTVEHNTQSSKSNARDSLYSVSSYGTSYSQEVPAELAGSLLPATTYTPPGRRAVQEMSEQQRVHICSASTPNLPLSTSIAPPVPAKDPRRVNRPVSATYQPYHGPASFGATAPPPPRKHAHTPARPSPLQMVISTPESRKNSAISTTEVTIMLSPRTAKSLSPPPRTSSLYPSHLNPQLSELPGTPASAEIQQEAGSKRDSMIRRKPIPSASSSSRTSPTASITELPGAEMTTFETNVQISPILSELPTDLPTYDRPISALLPDLPPTLSRLQTLRQRLSLVVPGGMAIEASGEKEIVAVSNADFTHHGIPSLRTFHHNLSDIELTALNTAGAGAMARRGRRRAWTAEKAVSMPEARDAAVALKVSGEKPEQQDGESFELEGGAVGDRAHSDEHEHHDDDAEIVEIGTARVVFGVAGVLGKVRSTESLRNGESRADDAEMVGRVLIRKPVVEKRSGMSGTWWHARF